MKVKPFNINDKMFDKNQLKLKLLKTKVFKECDELDSYVCLVFKNINRKRNEEGATQVHHIQPRCIFRFFKQEIDESNKNKVNLLYKDHILAHYYLCLSCSNKMLFYSLFLPLKLMVKNRKIPKEQLKQIKDYLIEYSNEIQELKDIENNIQTEKDRDFYELVSKYLKQGYEYQEISKIILGRKSTTIATRYLKYCELYGWESFNQNKNKPRFKEEQDKLYYDMVNNYLAKGNNFSQIAKILELSEHAVSITYKKICKRNNWKINEVNKLLEKRQRNNKNFDGRKKCDLLFYNKISNLLENNFTFKDIAKEIGQKYENLSSKYYLICKKYKLDNKCKHFWRPSFNKTKDINFYKYCNKYLKKGHSFNQIDKLLNKKNYSGSMYSRICKRYNLTSFSQNHKWNKKQDMIYYEMVNKLLKNNLSYRKIDEIMNKKSGYTASEYPRIIKHYNWPNLNKKTDSKVNWTEERKLEFYNIVNKLLINNKTFSNIAKQLKMNKNNVKSWYYRICKEFNLQNFNPRQKRKFKSNINKNI